MKYFWCAGITLAISFVLYGQKDVSEKMLTAVEFTGKLKQSPTRGSVPAETGGRKRQRTVD